MGKLKRLGRQLKARWHHFRSRHRSEIPADKFSRRTANATVFLAITSGATVWLLWNQLSEMHLDQRAWLGIDRVNQFDFKAGKDFSVPFDMTNTGKTPALHVKPKVSLKSLKKADVFTATYDAPKDRGSNGVVQPQQHLTLSTPPIAVSDAQFTSIKDGGGILYAYGDITYDDIYGKPHETTFCVMYYKGVTGPTPCDVYNEAN